jgi:type IV pilus assembly protein PilC
MSGFPDEDPPLPRPEAGRPKPLKPRPRPTDEDSSTFRPNPKKARASKPRADLDPDRPIDPGPGPSWWERLVFGSVSSGQLGLFCRHFGSYMQAGIDITRALSSLESQFARTALGPVIGRLRAGVKRGDTLGDLAEKEPRTFDALFVSMIRVAEARGGIPETLRLLAKHYEARQRLIRQARSALIYPAIVLLLASGVMMLLTMWLLPMFASMLRELGTRGQSLPLPSRILMGFSDFIRKAGVVVIPVVFIGTPILIYKLYQTAAGKRVMDRLMLMTPVFGPLLAKIDTTRFARTLAALLDAGVDVGSSINLTADVLHTEQFRDAIRDTRVKIINGEPLSEALTESRRFGLDVIAVIESGEETGKLPESLNHLADDYEERVEYTVKNLGQLVQPLLMIVLGLIVLFIILAVLLPYISILSGLAGGAPAGG